MRTLVELTIPVQAGNRSFKDEALGKVFGKFIERYHPESSYFFPRDGRRAANFVIDMKDPSELPSILEPLFLGLEAEIRLTPVMNAEDLQRGLQSALKNP